MNSNNHNVNKKWGGCVVRLHMYASVSHLTLQVYQSTSSSRRPPPAVKAKYQRFTCDRLSVTTTACQCSFFSHTPTCTHTQCHAFHMLTNTHMLFTCSFTCIPHLHTSTYTHRHVTTSTRILLRCASHLDSPSHQLSSLHNSKHTCIHLYSLHYLSHTLIKGIRTPGAYDYTSSNVLDVQSPPMYALVLHTHSLTHTRHTLPLPVVPVLRLGHGSPSARPPSAKDKQHTKHMWTIIIHAATLQLNMCMHCVTNHNLPRLLTIGSAPDPT